MGIAEFKKQNKTNKLDVKSQIQGRCTTIPINTERIPLEFLNYLLLAGFAGVAAAGLQPDCQRFYILAASPRREAGLQPDCQRFMGGGFRCRSKIQILLDPRYTRAGRQAFGWIFKDVIY